MSRRVSIEQPLERSGGMVLCSLNIMHDFEIVGQHTSHPK